MSLPVGYQRIRALKPVTYAREDHARGTVLVVDDDTATRLIKGKLAEAVTPPEPRPMIVTNCARCSAPMEFPAEPRVHERWTSCQAPGCGHGWLR